MPNSLFKYAELFLQAADAMGKIFDAGKFVIIVNKDSNYTTITIRLRKNLEQEIYKKYTKEEGDGATIRGHLETLLKNKLAGEGFENLSKDLTYSPGNYFCPALKFGYKSEKDVKQALEALYKILSNISIDEIIVAAEGDKDWESIPDLPTEEPELV